jgi:hypothetical protein
MADRQHDGRHGEQAVIGWIPHIHYSTSLGLAECAQALAHRRLLGYKERLMTHTQLVAKAVEWLRRYGCGIVLSEQVCASGEAPDAIGWKGACRSVVVECKLSRSDFLADRNKPFRQNPELGLGCERWYLTPAGLLTAEDLPRYWGLLESRAGKLHVTVKASRHNQRSLAGLLYEMNLLLASLRRVEVRIEPQTITEFLKWKNRMAEYNGGSYPSGLLPPEREHNPHLSAEAADVL